jgi:hypothetical protein
MGFVFSVSNFHLAGAATRRDDGWRRLLLGKSAYLCGTQSHIAMTQLEFDYARLDEILDLFDHIEGGYACHEALINNAPEDFDAVIRFLAAKGMLEEVGDGYKITYWGKTFHHQGGFVSQYKRERAHLYVTVIAAVTGVLTLLISLIALFR